MTQVAGLKVIARTSTFAFKGKNEDVRKIAEALGVTNVLEGSVRRAGNRRRVTAQLIHAADGTHLWSQRYDREMTDVFAVQDEIAKAIAGTLQIKLTLKPATARAFEPNLPAYEEFLKGRNQSYKSSAEAHALAEEYFKQAIALDPLWADPHSYLGRLYFTLGFYGFWYFEQCGHRRTRFAAAPSALPRCRWRNRNSVIAEPSPLPGAAKFD